MDPADWTRLIVGKISAQLGDCYEKAGFYRARRDATGVNPDRISSLDGLNRASAVAWSGWAIEEVFT